MRLIDADALMRDIQKYALSDGKFQHWVEVQPTIEPERKKGKWIETKADEPCFYRCSECGRLMDEESGFCPNCGCEMERWKR